MAMNELWLLTLPVTVGLLLGAFFFGGLRWTVIRGTAAQRPALWFFGSLLLRTSITLAGFHFVADDHWARWLSCLLGFVLARLWVIRLTRPPTERRRDRIPENRYAP
jgi:F1F0 ATPase subunit 2